MATAALSRNLEVPIIELQKLSAKNGIERNLKKPIT